MQVTRDPPPPLPGGYKMGEKVFCTAANYTFPSGNKVVHGQQGEVTGPATAEGYQGKGVAVQYPGNKRSIQCFLSQVRRLRAAAAATTSPAPPTRDAAHAPCTPRAFPR